MCNYILQKKDPLIIANRQFSSRLMLGTGKYKNFQQAQNAINASGCEILTIAVRRAQSSSVEGIDKLLNTFDWTKIWLMPNTAGSQTSEQAIRLSFLAREILKNLNYTNNNFLKLEVIPDPKYLLPDGLGTLAAAEYLISKNFDILPYINADPVLAKQLEELGCVTVMPLGSPIGSNQGLKNLYNIKIIRDGANVPVIVDAGIGSPSQASEAMEIGADGVLTNTAIAKAYSPKDMAYAMKLAVMSGRLAYLAGKAQIVDFAQPSSPIIGLSK
jgi:thiazole synthase